MRRPRVETAARTMEHVAIWTTAWAGSSWAFVVAAAMVIFWLASGPIFRFSDTWQLVMNTISSIVTFLMVFLLQRSQNKESLAMQVKLNEILAAQEGASNRLINVEDLSEAEVRELHKRYRELVERCRQCGDVFGPVTVEEQPERAPDDARRAAAS